MISVRLDKSKHNRQRFDCGVKALNHYLSTMANQQAGRDNTRTFVLEDEDIPEHIIGFYTLTMAPIDFNALPKTLVKKHNNAYAGGLIARLAVDKRYAKGGFGQWLLIDALKKLVSASEIVAFPFIIVDAKDGVSAFYQQFGFTAFANAPNKLFVTVAQVRSDLNL
jgi:GNAT superfamily N-acetyltransferase